MQYESSAVSSAAPLSTPSATSSSSAAVSAALGLSSNTTVTSSATAVSMATGSSKSSLPLTSKAPPNLPPGVPPLMSSYMIGQPAGLPFAFPGLPQQQLYSFEDLHLLHSRLPPMPPSTLPAARDGLSSVPYTGNCQLYYFPVLKSNSSLLISCYYLIINGLYFGNIQSVQHAKGIIQATTWNSHCSKRYQSSRKEI